jgi:NAD(P)-dependent dehydrogenase (short-subunit alcohol dehydrogenase family)
MMQVCLSGDRYRAKGDGQRRLPMSDARWAQAAVITGAESGIGRAIALSLAETHQAVGLTWVHAEEAVNTVAAEVERRGSRAVIGYLDLADAESIVDKLEVMLTATGPVSTLVNNAAMPFTGEFLECDLNEVRHVFDVNFFGHFAVTQVIAKSMIENGNGGVVVNVTSVQQERVKVGSSVYACAKAALAQLTRSAAVELAVHGVRVVSVAPGEIATGMNVQSDGTLGAYRRSIPMARSGRAEEVASLVRFLASPEAAYVTGATVVCDGGLTLPIPDS